MFRSVVVLMLSLILPTLASAQDTVQTQQRTHEVVKGETLWNLAQRYLGNPYRWPLIYKAGISLLLQFMAPPALVWMVASMGITS